MNEYIAARQQLADQAQQIEASEKLRMQQVRPGLEKAERCAGVWGYTRINRIARTG